METGSIIMFGVIAISSILSMLVFWLDHNSKHDLTIKTNPLSLRWICADVLGAIVTGAIFYQYVGAEMTVEMLTGAILFIAVIVSICVSKIACEGLGAFNKWMRQKAVEAQETAATLNDVMAALSKMQAENADLRKRLNL